jgi:hypothetical protein
MGDCNLADLDTISCNAKRSCHGIDISRRHGLDEKARARMAVQEIIWSGPQGIDAEGHGGC